MVFLVFTAWLILSQVMISLVQAFFAPAGYGFLAGITYAAQAGAHVVFIWIFRSHLPHAAGKKRGRAQERLADGPVFSHDRNWPVYGTPRPFFPISPDCTEYIGTNDG